MPERMLTHCHSEDLSRGDGVLDGSGHDGAVVLRRSYGLGDRTNVLDGLGDRYHASATTSTTVILVIVVLGSLVVVAAVSLAASV